MDGQQIWKLPGLSHDQFYAAAFFLSQNQKQQPMADRPAKATDTPRNDRLLLDSLALLFARACGSGAVTAANVTATALEMPETDGSALVIHIAKNASSQDLENETGEKFRREDEQFAKRLSTWLQTVNPQRAAIDREDEMWREMIIFWEQRINKYLRALARVKLEPTTKPELRDHYAEANVDLDAFESDFQLLNTALESMPNRTDTASKNEYLCEICFELLELSENRYPKYPKPTKNHQQTQTLRAKAEIFRKAIKHIKLLRNLRTVGDGLVRLRKDNPDTSIEFQLLEPQPSRKMDMKDILETMKLWAAPGDADMVFKNNVAQINNYYNKGDNAVRQLKFHCELQILEHCINSSKAFMFRDYIGCSKLSCHLCWAVLRNADYQTKGTHSIIYPDCAFPFKISPVSGHYRLAASLKREQDSLLDKILEYSMQQTESFTIHSPRSQTNPYTQLGNPQLDLRLIAADPQEQDLQTQSFNVLKLGRDGSSTLEPMIFHKLQMRIEVYGSLSAHPKWYLPDGTRWYDTVSNCHPQGDIDSKWVSEKEVMQSGNGTGNIWHWQKFKIILGKQAGEELQAHLQIPVLNDYWDNDIIFPDSHIYDHLPDPDRIFIPSAYLLGRIVSDEEIYKVPRAIRDLSADTEPEFKELFNQLVEWLRLRHRRWLETKDSRWRETTDRTVTVNFSETSGNG
ncbi:hypothetical protein F4777DRAFT_552926 [Nemania sp. FL0916]|nr:hypothetical protein F4777DRAFT_552926 [Nemania sp. FL0916]